MAPPLPIEIYQAIVDYIPAQKTLYTLLFTCRLLKACAERALFRHIDMGPNGRVNAHGLAPLQAKLIHIRNNPHLVCCIQSLAFFPASKLWETINEAMADLLPQMTNLKHFRLTAFHPIINQHSHHLRLRTLDVLPNINGGIARFMSSQPWIEELTIFSFQGVVTNITPGMLPKLHTISCPGNEDLSTLLQGRSVTRLHTFLGGFPLGSVAYEDRIKLQSLFVHYIPDSNWGSLLNLRYLRIYYSPQLAERIETLPKLHHLRIEIGHGVFGPEDQPAEATKMFAANSMLQIIDFPTPGMKSRLYKRIASGGFSSEERARSEARWG